MDSCDILGLAVLGRAGVEKNTQVGEWAFRVVGTELESQLIGGPRANSEQVAGKSFMTQIVQASDRSPLGD